MSEVLQTEEELKRKILFVPCKDKRTLHRWIQVFLGLDMPDCIVDATSTSSPMDMIWEAYGCMIKNDDPDFSRALYYASRESFKTLAASILEVLAVLHLERDVAHMAAIEQQARKCQSYVKGFFNKPILRDFKVGDNAREIQIVRYNDASTGDSLTEKQFLELPEQQKTRYREIKNYIRIILATMQSSNSEHVQYFCVTGDTRLLAKASPLSPRDRHSISARGAFRRCSGKEPGGRTGGEQELSIESPVDDVELLSIDTNTGLLSFKKVLRATQRYRPTITVNTSQGSITCTDDHPLWIWGKGFVQAGKICVGDKILSLHKMSADQGFNLVLPQIKAPDRVGFLEPDTDDWEQVVVGSVLGDAGIYTRDTGTPYLSENHCIEQKDYMEWKRSVLHNKLRTVDRKGAVSGYTGKKMVGYFTGHSPLLWPYVSLKRSLDGLDKVWSLGLAVWYMDDGCAGNGFRLSTECFLESQNETIRDFLWNRFKIQTKVCSYTRGTKKYYFIRGGIDAKRRLVEVCARHVHPTMAYKFDLSANKGICIKCGCVFWHYESMTNSQTCRSALCRYKDRLKSRRVLSVKESGKKWVYDFTVADNHNFFANGMLAKNCVDEVDVVQNPKAYEEAKMIPSPRDGKLPLTVLVSTRKFGFGLVQKEIDDAERSGLKIRHWNIIDVTEACPASRHRPDLPRLPIYRSEQTLQAISEADYSELSPDRQEKFTKDSGYSGCITNCKIFAACRGRLASEQKSTTKLLRPISHTTNQFRAVTVETAKAQLLCLKPSTEGLIYSRLDRDVHALTAAQIAERVTGEPHRPNLTKAELVAVLKSHEINWYGGMDFGYSHNFAVVVAAVDGNKCYVIESVAQAELDPSQQIDICDSRIKQYDPTIFPDTENPQMIKVFKKHGYKMRQWNKGKGTVIGGIEALRLKLHPAIGEPELFFLKEDEGCETLLRQLTSYHWKLDAAGSPTDIPNDEDDDLCDAMRYLIMNVFAVKGKVIAIKEESSILAQVGPRYHTNWMQEIISEKTGAPDNDEEVPEVVGRKGGLIWDI